MRRVLLNREKCTTTCCVCREHCPPERLAVRVFKNTLPLWTTSELATGVRTSKSSTFARAGGLQ
jgi:hypothetical protein